MADTATATQANLIVDDESLAEEQLLDELENGDIPAHIREARMESFKKQAVEFREMKDKQHGTYLELKEEKDFLRTTTNEERCIVHFFHEDFRKCNIMDTHLQKLAEKYFEVRFAKINVETAKFFVAKLQIRVLPAVYCFKDGIVVDKIIGFDDLGNTDSFQTETLERRIAQTGFIETKGLEAPEKKTVFGYASRKNDSDSDDDW